MSKHRTQSEIDWIKDKWTWRKFWRGSQWTAPEIAAMRQRSVAPLVLNRICQPLTQETKSERGERAQ